MSTWLSLVRGFVEIAVFFIRRYEESKWMNEGARRVTAQQIKEIGDALAQATNVEKEWSSLTAHELDTKLEAERWLRD